MSYNFQEIETKWQKYWNDNQTFKAHESSSKPKYYILDMFPYPSGAGLHVGHPLGYIASDIYTRFKRLEGYNVLHPMGYDAFGLPAEQYAIQTGRHPADTTRENIARYREQLDKIGFSYDWNREVQTCDPKYYKWTQWAFIQMFEHYYDLDANKALPIADLIKKLESKGSAGVNAHSGEMEEFSAKEWKSFDEKAKENTLQNYRLAFLAETAVNWCPGLGTVLANDEVKDGLSVRGSHPVEQKKMQQWCLRVSAYAPRLLDGLDELNWSDSLKEMQKNWIGKSTGAEVKFDIKDREEKIEVFTTRADTIFGVSFMVLAPESDYVSLVTTDEQRAAVEQYLEDTKKRSERDRLADVKRVTGVFTGAYCIHPFTGKDIPIWIGDYVLGGYGTGAVMAVPAHDSRDYAFAKHFGIEITQVVSGGDISEESYDAKEGTLMNSDFLNGLSVQDAIAKMITEVESRGLGQKQTNYRLRDAIFSRQRYWGEPFPIYFKDGVPTPLSMDDLPLQLPEVDKFLPTEDGQPPLGRAENWTTKDGHPLEMSTMPGFAGSSAYYLRYMDPHNEEGLVSKDANNYWQDVDLYIGGAEHATGHLIYSRYWNKFLFDIGYVCKEEPFKRLVNQGMIQGRSNFVYRLKGKNEFVSLGLKDQYDTQEIHVDVNIVHNDQLDMDAFKAWRPEFKDATFITESVDGKDVYNCGYAVEKMSKSMFNVVNPDTIVENYGADTLRLYEMFLGPLEQSKPWNTNGIEGVHRFLKKLWNLFYKDEKLCVVSDAPSADELKVLHTCIKKVNEDIDTFSFNTSISAFMICVNDLSKLKCHKKDILNDLIILLSPFAPHFCEELWQELGHSESITFASMPELNESYLVESTHKYPISVNGKMRFLMDISLDASKEEIEKLVLESEEIQKWIEGKEIKKKIIVPKKIVNIVVG
ncbi:leucyl-tRNA synthetase [Halobacteriovorax marinus SJ]|uniref:Leucine--tRNA ligase n=1 Tax=Halobacteriovorax marinus (strain ATCC BAA-682 / DSM 15412 / SJ) TaxID=862908 RepID=E1X4R1_HALMS|nr:leucine--tRNA ligase [Halobacteriovorax marinus]CBW27137.1 leucyl-tRNA synthetase [Halobacteriovorax marinus SJ]